ncbi:MAG: ribonuclease HII [Candidatus Omnitrophota bacterium]
MLYHEKKFIRQGKQRIAGVDEAGRGPLAGPVVAAAVILKEFKFSNRIADSKVLTRISREKAYFEIMDKACVGIGVVGEKEIDGINILKATLKAMEVAVYSLEETPDHLLIDGNVTPQMPYPKTSLINGESRSLSIACASIVAKVTRDFIMSYYDLMYPEYGFKQHKGYGTNAHFKALARFGPSPIHRRTFTLYK